MGVIYGWQGSTDAEPYALLTNMGARIFPENGIPPRGQSGNSFHAAGGGSGYFSARHEGILAIIEGHPRWKAPELARLANSADPATALAEGYRLHQKNILSLLEGDFSLAIHDSGSNTTLLAIDRLGIRPLAYAINHQTLIFGTQASALLAHPEVGAGIANQGIFNYLYFHMVPSPETLFTGIHKLQPGEYLEFKEGKSHTAFYWQLEFSESREHVSQLTNQLHQLLETTVQECVDNQETTGTFLSGGLDSSTVTGVYQQLCDHPVEAFAIGFDAEGFDEMEFARASARHFGVQLHEYYVTPRDVLETIPKAARAYDEPFGNASAIPAYFCALKARERGKLTLLAGDGGDEIFAGNARYAKQKVFELYHHVPPLLKTAFIEPLADHLPPLRKLKSYIEQANVPMPERMETYNFLHRFALNEIFDAAFLNEVDHEEPLRLLRSRWQQCGDASLVKKMLFLDHKFTLADNDLRKVNRMCELAGIDVRYPLLQEEMVEFAARIPTNLLLKGQELRTFYRRAMKGFLAKKTLEKHKHGFGLPFGLWMNEYTPLKEFAHDRLERIKARGFLNDQFIRKIIHAQETGHATYYGVFIWVLIMLEEWMEAHEVSL